MNNLGVIIMFVDRQLRDKLVEMFSKFSVVFLTGPRQSGKTTLTKNSFPNLKYINLENPAERQRIMEDPEGFLNQFENGVIIDEAQNYPDLFSYIQVYVDKRNNIPGQFLLTGSQNFMLNEKISQTLAGRVAILELLPLSFQEISKKFSAEIDISSAIFKGCYPELYSGNTPPKTSTDFFPNYIQTYLERDVRQIKNISNLNLFQNFVRLCAGRVGQIINYSSLGNDCGLSVPTIKGWISILEASYIVHTVYPYFLNINKRMVKTPKLYFYDTGLLCSLLGIKSVNELETHYAYGSIFENFIINEFIKTQYNKGERKNVYFLRDKIGHEIDCFIPNNNSNRMYEIKSSATFDKSFIKNIEYYNSDNSAQSFVIYNGNEKFKYKNVEVIPIKNWSFCE